MLDAIGNWARGLAERLGIGGELLLVFLFLVLGWWLGGPWFLAALLASMALLARGL